MRLSRRNLGLQPELTPEDSSSEDEVRPPTEDEANDESVHEETSAQREGQSDVSNEVNLNKSDESDSGEAEEETPTVVITHES